MKNKVNKIKRKIMGEKKTKKARLKKIILILISIIALTTIILTALETNIYQNIQDNMKEPGKIEINDRCSLIMGKVLHEIKNKDECKIRCKNECEIRDKKFIESEFIEKINSCHICNCYCK